MKKLILGVVLALASFVAQAGQTVIYSSAVRTATSQSADIVRTTERYISVIFVTSVVPGVDTVTVTIQGKDALGNYYTLLVGAAVSTATTNVYSVGPALPATANVSANAVLPDIYRLVITHSAATSFTYTATVNTSQ